MTPSPLATLAACLAYRDAPAPAAWEPVLQLATDHRLASALVARLRGKGAVPNVPAIVLPNGIRTVTAQLDLIWQAHLERTATLTAHLTELVAAMNAAGLEPILLKGGRALATGAPEWRSMRDLDLLLPGRDAARAHEVALGLGYHPNPGSTEKAGKHHFQPLFRDDFPGWIEIHSRAATHRAEGLLPTPLLAAMTSPVTLGPARARVLTGPAHTLHALIHHHVGHRGDKGGAFDLKGLFEFTADLRSLTAAERETLLSLALRHPRLLAALDLWLAGAHTLFALPVEPPFTLVPDAIARAARALARTETPGTRYGGVGEEIAFASDATRLVRQPTGHTPLGRLALRGKILTSMFRPMIDLFGAQPDQ